MIYLLIAFWGFSSIVAAVLAKSRNRSLHGWFWLGLIVGPFAWIVAALPVLPANRLGGYIPPKTAPEQDRLARIRSRLDRARR